MNGITKTLKNAWVLGSAGVILLSSGLTYAQAASNNYRLEEPYFGTGGELDASSNNYRSQQSVGSLGVGNTSSTNYDASAGGTTQYIPFIEFVVTQATVDLGTLSTSSTSYGSPTGGTCGCSFYVKSYLSSAYTIINASPQPPTSEGGAFLDPKSSQGAPSANINVEEFGFNLVANTVPGSFGADPVNLPDNSFADGKVSAGYEIANEYKFGAGDIIAESPATAGNQAVGETDYTISYIAKKKPLTEAGAYKLDHVLVAVATF